MNRRRVFGVAAVIAVMGCLIGAACTFPEVGFHQGAAAEGGEGGADGSMDSPADVGADVLVRVDGGDPDAQIVKDAGMKIDASGCLVCDCDGDGFNDTTKAGCMDAGGANDCDDTDTRTKPSQGYLDIVGEPPRDGDWNCSGKVELVYPPNINCMPLAPSACDGVIGFEDMPSCGTVGKYVECKVVTTPPLNLDPHCVVGKRESRTQACK